MTDEKINQLVSELNQNDVQFTLNFILLSLYNVSDIWSRMSAHVILLSLCAVVSTAWRAIS